MGFIGPLGAGEATRRFGRRRRCGFAWANRCGILVRLKRGRRQNELSLTTGSSFLARPTRRPSQQDGVGGYELSDSAVTLLELKLRRVESLSSPDPSSSDVGLPFLPPICFPPNHDLAHLLKDGTSIDPASLPPRGPCGTRYPCFCDPEGDQLAEPDLRELNSPPSFPLHRSARLPGLTDSESTKAD